MYHFFHDIVFGIIVVLMTLVIDRIVGYFEDKRKK